MAKYRRCMAGTGERLALQLDNATNNTSLVMAIELGDKMCCSSLAMPKREIGAHGKRSLGK